MFVTSISFRGTFKWFWDLTGKSTILEQSVLLWISQADFQHQSIYSPPSLCVLSVWMQTQKKKCIFFFCVGVSHLSCVGVSPFADLMTSILIETSE